MTSHAENTQRLAKNTLMLYGRMLFGMLVSLYTSRVILRALGVEDFGIYNVVGGLVAMFQMISSSLSSAASRFLTFEIGKGDTKKLKSIFSTSLLIHFALAFLIVILTEGIGVWFLNTHMVIPPDRLLAANWVFQCSVLSFVFGLISIPYRAAIVAHERMAAFAYIGILEICLRLFIVLFIAYCHWHYDGLIVFSILTVVVGLIVQCIYISYCNRFEECHHRCKFEKKYWKEMMAFAGWNFIGCSAAMLKDQGVNILMNVFSGPVLNAARGIATSVNKAIISFATNFMTALNPQITKSYASGDTNYMLSLVEKGAKFSYYIVLLFALPIILETDFILRIWLVDYPEHTLTFVRLILILSLSDVLSNTLITLQLATGKIRNYQIAVGGTLLLNFPLSYVCLKVGLPPEMVYIVAIAISCSTILIRLIFLRRMIGLDIKRFLIVVCLNTFVVTIVALLLPVIPYVFMHDGLLRFLIILILSLLSSSLSAFFIGCNKHERCFILDRVKGRFIKVS